MRIGLEISRRSSTAGPDFIAHHHERLDGSGYPRGLRDEISVGGGSWSGRRVRRPHVAAYREARSPEDALAYMSSLGPAGACPTVLPALARVVTAGHVLVFINDT
jgi:HD-GYP domain-containing protein (c-di-GMP phosphodiesterase class II)